MYCFLPFVKLMEIIQWSPVFFFSLVTVIWRPFNLKQTGSFQFQCNCKTELQILQLFGISVNIHKSVYVVNVNISYCNTMRSTRERLSGSKKLDSSWCKGEGSEQKVDNAAMTFCCFSLICFLFSGPDRVLSLLFCFLIWGSRAGNWFSCSQHLDG